MSSINVPKAGALLTSDGGADGAIVVADTTPFYPGTEAWLSNNAGLSQKVLIVKVIDGTTMKVRPLDESGSNVNTLNYELLDASAFLTADDARIDMPSQTARIDWAYSKHDVI